MFPLLLLFVSIGSQFLNRDEVTYDVIDQRIVDGLVNATGATAEGGGGLLRIIQTGRVQQYAAILFGAVVIFAAALVLAT